jgi:hypothetical protein
MTSYIGNFTTISETPALESLAAQNIINDGSFTLVVDAPVLEQIATKNTIKDGNFYSFSDDVDSTLEVFLTASFIVKPNNISLGQDNIFTLDKNVLLSESLVQNDPYFSDSNNWKYVYAVYRTDSGQLNGVRFDVGNDILTGNFNPTEKAISGADWRISAVMIIDFDKGYLKFQRSDLEVNVFDILNVT